MQDYEQQVNGVGHLVAKLSTETTNSTNDLETRLQVHLNQIALLCYVFCSCLLTYQHIIISTNRYHKYKSSRDQAAGPHDDRDVNDQNHDHQK